MEFVEGFGEVWFHEQPITNILSYTDSCDRHHVYYENWIQDAFHAGVDDRTMIFRRNKKKYV